MEGNPVHDFVRRAADLAPPALSLDVTIDRDRKLTGVFSGPLHKAHRAACETVMATSVSQVHGPFHVVVTTNGGYPLDRNLYQAVKGMAAAERVVAGGGIVVMAAACSDGIPAGGAFAGILEEASGPAELARPRGPGRVDVWQAQVLGRVLERADVWLYSGGLADEEVRSGQMRPVPDVTAAVAEALGRRPGGRLCVLPRGPLTVATDRGHRPRPPTKATDRGHLTPLGRED
jgi:nickel-dependent lactate racemase